MNAHICSDLRIRMGQQPQLIVELWLHCADAYKTWCDIAKHAGQVTDSQPLNDRCRGAGNCIRSVGDVVVVYTFLNEFGRFEAGESSSVG
jgi:hypothetical protein